ncbi:FAD-dependent monooxygenase [Saccharothrix sp. NRRL B-16314]|uniref:FAD-dependent monooxygenase n=1 Tax=Saccharothrix sp. NRRL B-16314 TaxID=1463825 RepID=UPI00068F6629|nr:FAD-dependent monooxygenase [Saccharothrix sp. NRRL B-16314]
MSKVLISGCGVAGLALAGLLRRHGSTVTVIERSPRPRSTGVAVDIRGVALTVAERMGLLGELERLRTRLRGMSNVDSSGVEQWRSEEFVLSSGQVDSADIEILREDLTSILRSDLAQVDDSRDDTATELVFGDWITGLDEHADGVRVTFEHGAPREFDLVIGADGLYSDVRRLAFGPHEKYLRHLNSYIATFGGTNRFDLQDWELWVQDPAATYVLYPTRDNSEVRVIIGIASPDLIEDRDVALHRKLVAERIDQVSWQTAAMHATLEESEDFYFGAMAQVRMERWSTGRVVLVGDAASSPSPLTGQGTSVALVQAFVLAQELSSAEAAGADHRSAFTRYESRLRDFVEQNQTLVGDSSNPFEEDSDHVDRLKVELERIKNALDLDAPAPEAAASAG